MSSIGERLREERERLGFSQTALGAIGGVQKQAQLKYEKGERFPDATYLDAAAKVGADVQYIITGVRSSAALSADEQELVTLFRAAPLAVKASTVAGLKAGAEAQQAAQAPHYEGSHMVFHQGPTGTIVGHDLVQKSSKKK